MINFTVGPVQMDEQVCQLGSEQIPYFRTPEFSAVMKENEGLFLELAGAPGGSRAVFLTASGTGAMEAAVANTLSPRDKVLVVDGGSFGHRFCELCQVHEVPFAAIELRPGESLKEGHLAAYKDAGFTAFLVNLDETSTGTLYDIDLIAEFCEEQGLFLIVDAISAFLADPVNMSLSRIDVLITGSQKALALPPGVSLLALAPRALERVSASNPHCLYFDLKRALKDGERGQTPFTPAVGVLLQMNARLRSIMACGGAAAEVSRVQTLGHRFRESIADMPFSLFSESPANGVTALRMPEGSSAKDLFAILKDEYGIWVCPNGGDLAETVFRVGHIGSLTDGDYEVLERALREVIA